MRSRQHQGILRWRWLGKNKTGSIKNANTSTSDTISTKISFTLFVQYQNMMVGTAASDVDTRKWYKRKCLVFMVWRNLSSLVYRASTSALIKWNMSENVKGINATDRSKCMTYICRTFVCLYLCPGSIVYSYKPLDLHRQNSNVFSCIESAPL